ncbi:hypothetical protein P148_SR1C00001G0390 [candidate division SR1 bacterium RAAC1_SR1_1]|nr:hypothetical protein P148_SR1C00001G0390 [candidate division SR1 bacterium RAAC1_SR1_1]
MFKKLILILNIGILFFSFGFAYKELIIQNIDKKPVRVIKVILDGQHYVVSSVAEDGGATLQELTKKVGGDTAVNGTFFCPDDYSSCGGTTHTNSERIYLGDGASWSRHRPDTSIRMVFGFDKDGNSAFVQNNMGKLIDAGLWIKPDQKKLESLQFGIGGFPAFLLEGEDVVEGYNAYLDTKMNTAGNKTFICSTEDGSTIYMGVVGGINIPQMPAYLKKNFDCRNALNLDAGNSIGMIYSGFVLDQSNRTRIMDAFVVLTREQYINLTRITPSNKTPYDAEEQYQLTEKDQQKVKTIYNALQPFIIQNGTKQKRSFISLLRSAVTAPKIVADPQKLAIIKDLLWRFFVIGEL